MDRLTTDISLGDGDLAYCAGNLTGDPTVFLMDRVSGMHALLSQHGGDAARMHDLRTVLHEALQMVEDEMDRRGAFRRYTVPGGVA